MKFTLSLVSLSLAISSVVALDCSANGAPLFNMTEIVAHCDLSSLSQSISHSADCNAQYMKSVKADAVKELKALHSKKQHRTASQSEKVINKVKSDVEKGFEAMTKLNKDATKSLDQITLDCKEIEQKLIASLKDLQDDVEKFEDSFKDSDLGQAIAAFEKLGESVGEALIAFQPLAPAINSTETALKELQTSFQPLTTSLNTFTTNLSTALQSQATAIADDVKASLQSFFVQFQTAAEDLEEIGKDLLSILDPNTQGSLGDVVKNLLSALL